MIEIPMLRSQTRRTRNPSDDEGRGRHNDLAGDRSPVDETRVDAAIAELSERIGATDDLEETVVAPVLVPAVLHEPVGSVVLLTPTDNLDGVTTEKAAVGVLVHTALVGQEIAKDHEHACQRTLRVDLLLHRILARDIVDRALAVVHLGGGPALTVGASPGALGGGQLARAIFLRGIHGVVRALRHAVGQACGLVTVLATAHDAEGLEVVPSSCGLPAIAAHAAGKSAARDGVLRGDLMLHCSIGLDANAVGHRLHAAECPA
mmetsp:Transcript_15061/g.31465  ORF Transcript_15061/g.31465 Transcript_15061/m.31465 type:complete len:262 (+) Transcript_15061:161-946(+)